MSNVELGSRCMCKGLIVPKRRFVNGGIDGYTKWVGEKLPAGTRDEEASSKHLLVGAIDFGTTYSGWAFSLVSEYESQPTKVATKHWHSGGTLVTEKAPTCVLIKPDGQTLEAFGYDAENTYRALAEKKAEKGYYYFRRFKMTLNKKLTENVRRNYTIETDVGQSLSALTVFSLVIRYLTKDMLETANNGVAGTITMDDVMWVLTVPAIWTDSAKNFMREAAEEAGIDGDRLVLCLEPEAASIFCRHLPIVKKSDVSIASFSPGTKYMILDCGGGTVDITVHQVERSGGLKEVHAASGGGWGGILVDEAFEKFLVDIVTRRVYDEFVKTEKEDWIDLWRDFEIKKKTIKPQEEDGIQFVMKIPASLSSLYQDTKNMRLKEAVELSKYSSDVELDRDKMKIGASVARSLFDTSVNKTVSHVKTLMRDPKVRDIKAILMVGGFSDSPMLQKAIKSGFRQYSVITPTDAGTSILKGAVIFGHSPESITERVLKYTYGVDTCIAFIEDEHPRSKRIVNDSGVRCKDIFDKHAEKDQTVKVGESCAQITYTPSRRSQQCLDFNCYATQLKNPKFVDEGCTKIGTMRVGIPQHSGDLKNGVSVSFKFGGTEIEITGHDKITGKETTVTVDFLG